MDKLILFFIALLHLNLLSAQTDSPRKLNNIGLSYFGELGFRPGLELDYGYQLSNKGQAKEDQKRHFNFQLHLRPAIAYYRYAHNSNNYLFATKLNYKISLVNNSNLRYLFIEPFARIGYLRKSYLGEKFTTTDQGLESSKFAGTSSIALGGGLNLGGYICKNLDWIIGLDYFIEKTEDQLILHRFVAIVGTRIKL